MADAKENSTILRSPLVRLSYPVFTLQQAQVRMAKTKLKPGEVPSLKYGCTLIADAVSMAHPSWKTRMPTVLSAVANLAKVRWPAEYKQEGAPWFDDQAWKSPWLDGGKPKYADKSGLGKGTRFIRPTSNRPVACVGRDKLPVSDPDLLYPGCYVYALLTPFFYSGDENHGISLGLRGIQFAQDGERLDDAIDVNDYFEPLEGDELPTGDDDVLAQMFKV